MNFDELAADVLVEVITFLDLTDVYSVRNTCQRLSALTYERAVWQRLFDCHCDKYNLFRPSFESASMTAAQLEAVVCRPSRVAALLRQSVISTPPDNFLRLEGNFPSEPGERFEMVKVVPGGRYVLTLAKCASKSRALQLWDLNGPRGPQDEVLPVARTVLQRESTGVRSLQACAQGTCLRVLLNASGAESKCWSIYEVDVQLVEPKFSVVATQNIGRFESMRGWSDPCLLTSDSVAFFMYRAILYWHIGHDTVVEWILPDHVKLNGLTALDNILVLFCNPAEVIALELPDDALEKDFVSLLSSSSIPVLIAPGRSIKESCLLIQLWAFPAGQTVMTLPVHLDLVAVEWSTSSNIVRCMLDHCILRVRNGENGRQLLLVCLASSEDAAAEDFQGLCSGWITEKDHLLTWQDGQKVFGRYMSTRPALPDGHPKGVSGIFNICEAYSSDEAHSICPSSGLIAVICALDDPTMVPRNCVRILSVL